MLIVPPPPPPPLFLGTDSETAKTQAGRLAPPLVCVSTAARVGQGFQENLYGDVDGVAFYRRALVQPNLILVIHNAPFDLGVACNEDPEIVPLVFDAYRAGRVICTLVKQKVIDVARGMRQFRRVHRNGQLVVTKASYGLDDLINHYYQEFLEKKDTWRLSYAFLKKIPVEQWPPAARRYAIKDAVEHLRLHEAQERYIQENIADGFLPNQQEQQIAAWALHLMSMWGLRADPKAVEYFIGHCQEQVEKMRAALAHTGILKPDGKRSRIMAEIRRRVAESFRRASMSVPMTPPSARHPQGQVKTDEDTLRLTDDEYLHVLADSLTFQKHLGQWGPVVRAATLRAVCCSYNVLVDNGRTSCSGSQGQEGTNIQNPPRKGDVRPCFIPRKGWGFVSTDADTIEMRANAQNCLELVGWSRMAEALWAQHKSSGPDLHVCLAASVASITKEEAHALHKAGDALFKNTRQMAKHGNFSFLGGAGARRFAGMAHGFGICLSASSDNPFAFKDACPVFVEEEVDGKKRMVTKWVSLEAEIARAWEIKKAFLMTWPEMIEYFRIITMMIESGRPAKQLRSGRIRGDNTFTSLSNTFFSGRVADSMKEIVVNLAEECYTGRCTQKHVHGGDLCTLTGRSILFGSRPVMFLHDEPILEHPLDTISDRGEKQRRVVVEGLQTWMPDVPCTSSAVAMLRWQKGAEPLFVDGKLVPVKPVKVGSKIKWVQDFGEEEEALAA